MDGEIPNVPHPEDFMMGIIHGEIPYVPEDAGEGAGEGASEGEEEDVSSFRNLFGHGIEIEMFDEGKINNDANGNCKRTARYIYIEPLVIRRAIGIYV
jgi:hypothetical protein